MNQPTHSLDPRVARTQQRLHEALIALTLEHGWEGVRVQQVCARAGIGRSTFYVHFADTEDLLLSGLRREHIVPHARGEFGFLRPLIEHVGAQRALFAALVGTRCERAVRLKFMDVVSELVEADVARIAPPGAQRTAAVRYVAGACNETLTWWLEQRAPEAPSEIEHWLRRFSMGATAQLR